MRCALFGLALLVAGCSGSPTRPTPVPSPTPTPSPSPSPQPAPRPTVAGTITDTVSGARVGSFSQEVDRLPALLPVSLSGFVTRQAWVTSTSPTVDLIRESGFDLGFYRQFVRNGLESSSTLEPLRRLTTPPAIYIQRAGLSDAMMAALEHGARSAVYELSGLRFGVVVVESGTDVRADREGWITVEFTDTDPFAADGRSACGRARVGTPAGHVWIITGRAGCGRSLQHTLAHEIGHSMGFWHVEDTTALMSVNRPLSHSGLASPRERHHAGIAYARAPGNRDIDQDVAGSASLLPRIVID